MKRQTIAPRYHAKGKILDALAVLLLMLVTAFLGCAVVLLSTPEAKADVDQAALAYSAIFGDAVCSTLDDYPSFDGIIGIGQAIRDDGLTLFQAGEVIQISVQEICPRHTGLLKRFVATYGSKGVAA